MRKILKISALLLLAATAITVSSPPVGLGEPAPGTISWVSEVSEAKEWLFMPFRSPSELVPRLARLLDLYRGCDECRIEAWKDVDRLLRDVGEDSSILHEMEEAVYAGDDVRRGRLLVEGGRFEEAIRVVTHALRDAHVMEERLALIEVLAEARRAAGDTNEADRLTRELLRDMPIEPDHCDRALEWWVRLGEAPVDDGPAGEDGAQRARRVASELARVEQLEATRGNDGYVSCLHNHWLQRADWLDRRRRADRRPAGADPGATLPTDIVRSQEELALRTTDAKIRAAILLSAAVTASRSASQERSKVFELIERARTSHPDPTIEVGALRTALAMRDGDDRTDRTEQVVSKLIEQYGAYEASWDACEYAWLKLAAEDRLADGFPAWRDRCAVRLGWSRNAGGRWKSIVRAVEPDHKGAEEILDALVSLAPPAEVVPSLLLRRAEAIRAIDPGRAWQLTAEAIRSPRFFLDRDDPYFPKDAPETAEGRGDFETALYLQILDGPPAAGGGTPGEAPPSSWWDFQSAYYRVRLGIDVAVNWKVMLDRVPADPAGPSALRWHSPEYLERVVAAAKIARTQGEAIERFEALEVKYRGLLAGVTPTPDGRSKEAWQPTVNQVTGALAKCVRDLEESRPPS